MTPGPAMEFKGVEDPQKRMKGFVMGVRMTNIQANTKAEESSAFFLVYL